MITKVTHISIFVSDQDEALKFYTEKLDLQVNTDETFDDFRWLTLNTQKDKNLEICLIYGQPCVDSNAPILSFETNNCNKTYQELKKKGVKFLQEPKEEPWGMGAVFQDPFGNIFYLNQPK